MRNRTSYPMSTFLSFFQILSIFCLKVPSLMYKYAYIAVSWPFPHKFRSACPVKLGLIKLSSLHKKNVCWPPPFSAKSAARGEGGLGWTLFFLSLQRMERPCKKWFHMTSNSRNWRLCLKIILWGFRVYRDDFSKKLVPTLYRYLLKANNI